MNETVPTMPTKNPRDCNCKNKTKLNSPTASDQYQAEIVNHVIIVVTAALGFLALLTIIVSVWSIRRCYLNMKTRRSWDVTPVKKEDKSTKLERNETFTVTPIDMYGGSLQDLRRYSEERVSRVIVSRDLQSAHSHNFLHRGDHNNTIISSLSATWSIQTLSQPTHPGETVITKATDNPLYARPVIASKRCASSNALYESADKNLLKAMDLETLRYFRKKPEPRAESPVYERIIELQKNPGSNPLGKPKLSSK